MAKTDDLLKYGLITKEELSKTARSHGFTQPRAVELFRWDLEMVSQLQGQSESFVLKGGAAAQLYLPVEKQRASVDVDLTYPPKAGALDDLMRALNKKFASRAPYFQFNRYRPKNPTANLPMKTYDVDLPGVLGNDCSIKLDILLVDSGIPSTTILRAETFAAVVEDVRCVTVGALIGDKLLTLAKDSIGIRKVKDYPKQMYDLEMLASQRECNNGEISDIAKAVEILTPIEAGFRDKQVEPLAALASVVNTMSEFSRIDLSSADARFKKAVNDFQQFYVSESERATKLYQWSCRALRLRFLASLIQLQVSGKLTVPQVEKLWRTSKEISSQFATLRGAQSVAEARDFLAMVAQGEEQSKELRGKPLERVFWQVLRVENVDDLGRLLV